MDFEKLSGYQVFKKPNRNPFRSSSSLSIRFPFVFAIFFIPSYRLLSSYFDLVGGFCHCLMNK